MKLLSLVTFTLLSYGCVAPPVTEKKKTEEDVHDNEVNAQALEVEYKRYLQEVVQLLEGDEDFKKKLMDATPEQIKTGDIAEHVDALHHGVRTKLDELKRQELERLRHEATRLYELDNGIDRKHLKIAEHLDASNPHTFEIEDLRKLILHTTRELEATDVERKKEFKEYEMQKELTYQEQLKHMDEQNRLAAQKQHEEMVEKHNKHAPIHHPGGKDQFEQVWEEQDHMAADNFNPKTFFHLHDLDGNGVWDAIEVKALFKKELDKMYDPNAPEDDLKERYEEMERMREHVFNESDTNKDQLISYQEFLDQTKRDEFQKEKDWDPIDNSHRPVYNNDEYRQYANQHEAEIRRMIEQGIIPAAPPGYIPMVLPPGPYGPGGSMPPQPHHGVNMPPPGSYNPNMPPQGHAPPYNPNQIPQYNQQFQGHPNQAPPYNPQQHQTQQQQYQAPPQQQQQYQAPPQQQQQYQAPPQQQQYQAPPQQQQQYQAPPQQQQQYQAPPPQQQNPQAPPNPASHDAPVQNDPHAQQASHNAPLNQQPPAAAAAGNTAPLSPDHPVDSKAQAHH